MAKVGRNEPCECGSGRKYKHCCLAGDEGLEVAWQRMRRAEGQLVPLLFRRALERYGSGFVDAAWDEFGCRDEGEIPHEQVEFDTIFVPWLVFNWVPDHSDEATPAIWPTAPLGRLHLDEEGARLDDVHRRFLEIACSRPYSFYAVTAATPGRSLALRDILTGSAFTVLERQASRTLQEGDILFTRIVSLDGVAIMVGGAPIVIPPPHHLRLLDLREAIAGGGSPLTDDNLHDWSVELLDTYHEIVDELRHPRLPILSNTDGDPLAPTTLRFELRCSPAEAFESLLPLALDSAPDLERDHEGGVRTVRFNWLKPGNARHTLWENTTLGQIRIEGPLLVADVNSERRAQAIRAEIESRLASGVLFRDATTESIEALLAKPRSRRETSDAARESAETERLNALPEVQAYLREMATRHWESWIDEPLPALHGETPRQAAESPRGRERLEALFGQFAWQARHGMAASAMEPDVAALRARLGL